MRRLASSLLLSVMTTGSATAQTTTRYAETTTRDRFSIGVSYNPCWLSIDTERRPEIRSISSYSHGEGHFGYVHKMRVWLKAIDGVCGVPPPGGGATIDLGLLPQGSHFFNVIVAYPDTIEYTFNVNVDVAFTPSDAISGAWYSPQQSGRGIFLTKLPLHYGYSPQEQQYAIYWATHDENGNPTWLLANAPMTDFIVSGQAITTDGTPLSSNPTTLQQRTWGTLSFEYLSCGKGRLSWDADDPAIMDGSIDVVQLVRPVGLPGCGFSANIEAVWLE